MFVLHAENTPHSSTKYFGEGNGEGQDSGMLKLDGPDSVAYPIESEDRIDHHCDVIQPDLFVTKSFPEEHVLGIRVTKT
jgi:hypothetical protein